MLKKKSFWIVSIIVIVFLLLPFLFPSYFSVSPFYPLQIISRVRYALNTIKCGEKPVLSESFAGDYTLYLPGHPGYSHGLKYSFAPRFTCPEDFPKKQYFPQQVEDPKSWQRLNLQHFTIAIPQDWSLQELPISELDAWAPENEINQREGLVGSLVGPEFNLRYDFGIGIKTVQQTLDIPLNDYFDSYTSEITAIDSLLAYVITPNFSGEGFIAVDFPEWWPSFYELRIFGTNLSLTQQEIALHILKSVRYTK